MTKATQQT